MKLVELYGRVRYAVRIEAISRREAGRRFGIDPRTVAKMLAFSVPPGYRRSRPPVRPKLDGFVGLIDQILAEDKGRPAKQRHTSKRIFERLRDEHGYAGGLTIVKDYLLAQRRRQREMFVPLRHDPGHAQADFGEALAVIGGVERKIHFFAMDLPHSDAGFVQAYPAETLDLPIVQDHRFGEDAVDIHADDAHTSNPSIVPSSSQELAGYTATTDPRSQRIRASRRGDHPKARARSPCHSLGLPALACS